MFTSRAPMFSPANFQVLKKHPAFMEHLFYARKFQVIYSFSTIFDHNNDTMKWKYAYFTEGETEAQRHYMVYTLSGGSQVQIPSQDKSSEAALVNTMLGTIIFV